MTKILTNVAVLLVACVSGAQLAQTQPDLQGEQSPVRQGRIAKAAQKAIAQGKTVAEIGSPMGEYPTAQSFEEVVLAMTPIIGEVVDKVSVPDSDFDGIWTWYKLRVQNNLCHRTIPTGVPPSSFPKALLPVGENEVVIRIGGGDILAAGVRVATVGDDFPRLLMNHVYLVFLGFPEWATEPGRVNAEVGYGPAGIFRIDKDGRFLRQTRDGSIIINKVTSYPNVDALIKDLPKYCTNASVRCEPDTCVSKVFHVPQDPEGYGVQNLADTFRIVLQMSRVKPNHAEHTISVEATEEQVAIAEKLASALATLKLSGGDRRSSVLVYEPVPEKALEQSSEESPSRCELTTCFIKAVYLPDFSIRQLTVALDTLRSRAQIARIAWSESSHTIVFQGSSKQLALAEELINGIQDSEKRKAGRAESRSWPGIRFERSFTQLSRAVG